WRNRLQKQRKISRWLSRSLKRRERRRLVRGDEINGTHCLRNLHLVIRNAKNRAWQRDSAGDDPIRPHEFEVSLAPQIMWRDDVQLYRETAFGIQKKPLRSLRSVPFQH